MHSFVIYKKSSFFTLTLLSSALLPIQNLIVTESVFFVYFLSFFICVLHDRPSLTSTAWPKLPSVSLGCWADHVWMGKDMEGR